MARRDVEDAVAIEIAGRGRPGGVEVFDLLRAEARADHFRRRHAPGEILERDDCGSEPRRHRRYSAMRPNSPERVVCGPARAAQLVHERANDVGVDEHLGVVPFAGHGRGRRQRRIGRRDTVGHRTWRPPRIRRHARRQPEVAAGGLQRLARRFAALRVESHGVESDVAAGETGHHALVAIGHRLEPQRGGHVAGGGASERDAELHVLQTIDSARASRRRPRGADDLTAIDVATRRGRVVATRSGPCRRTSSPARSSRTIQRVARSAYRAHDPHPSQPRQH